MKKLIASILTLTLLAMTFSAFAEESPQQSGAPQAQTQNETPDAVSSATQTPEERSGGSRLPDSKQPVGNGRNGGQQKHEQKNKSRQMRGFDALAAQGVISQETADRIRAYLKEQKLAEKPADFPALMQQLLDAEIISQSDYDALLAARTDTGSDAENAEENLKDDSGRHGNKKKEKKPGDERQEGKARLDQGLRGFDAFAARGVISQETADQIKAYLKEHKFTEKPADFPALLKTLLDAEIITQAEYEAMLAAQADHAA